MGFRMHKVFVGTMRSIENEFERSRVSLYEQRHVSTGTYIVENKPEHEAARLLYSKWNAVKDYYDFFVQLDPDVVLAHPNVLFDACNLLTDNPQFTSLQAPLHDYLSDAEVMGLNVYSTRVDFNVPGSNLYTDRCTSNNVTLRPDNFKDFPASLVPAGVHSPDPSPLQAYHYGVHRGLKQQFARRRQVIEACKLDPTLGRAMAVLGFEHSRNFVDGGFNYNDKKLSDMCEHAKNEYDVRLGILKQTGNTGVWER